MHEIRLMVEQDLPEVGALLDASFGAMMRHLAGPPPEGNRPEGVRIQHRFYRPNTTGFTLLENGVLRGAAFLQRNGSRHAGGPVAVHPRCTVPDAAGLFIKSFEHKSPDTDPVQVVDSATFLTSPLHLQYYFRTGHELLFPELWMQRSVGARPSALGPAGAGLERVFASGLTADAQPGLRAAMADLGDRIHPGFDVGDEYTHVLGRGIGDTLCVYEGGALVGFAVAHFGPGSEAFVDGDLNVRYLLVRRGHPRARDIYDTLLDGLEERARTEGLQAVSTLASTARRAPLEGLYARGYGIRSMLVSLRWLRHPSTALDARTFEHPADYALMDAR